MTDVLEPFAVAATQAALDDVHRRLAGVRWPDDPGNEDWSYGVNAAYLRELVGYWRDVFDWRAVERKINAFGNFRTQIDGVHRPYRRGDAA